MSEFLKWYRKYEKRRIFSAQYAEQHSHAAWDAGRMSERRATICAWLLAAAGWALVLILLALRG